MSLYDRWNNGYDLKLKVWSCLAAFNIFSLFVSIDKGAWYSAGFVSFFTFYTLAGTAWYYRKVRKQEDNSN